jgi:hypothetical protein
MTTSGTVGATTIDVTALMEHSIRKCGVLVTSIGGEEQNQIRENLFLWLTDLANDGVNLFCVLKQNIALSPGQSSYVMPAYTVDLLKALYRKMTFPAGTTSSPSGLVTQIDFGGSFQQVSSVGMTMNAGTNNLVIESSSDGATWGNATIVPTFTSTLGQLVWYDTEPEPTREFWRVRETVAVSSNVTAVQWGVNPYEITMAPLSRTSYLDLPNKEALGTGLQYWFDKQVQPVIRIWQVPNDATAQVVAWTHVHIQDVGSLTNTLAIPTRWYQATIFGLAQLICPELPADKIPPGRQEWLDAQAKFYLERAKDGERDGSPTRIIPNLRPYTR